MSYLVHNKIVKHCVPTKSLSIHQCVKVRPNAFFHLLIQWIKYFWMKIFNLRISGILSCIHLSHAVFIWIFCSKDVRKSIYSQPSSVCPSCSKVVIFCSSWLLHASNEIYIQTCNKIIICFSSANYCCQLIRENIFNFSWKQKILGSLMRPSHINTSFQVNDILLCRRSYTLRMAKAFGVDLCILFFLGIMKVFIGKAYFTFIKVLSDFLMFLE